jgi:hypothetical protein
MVAGALYLGLKRPRREADHSPPSSAEVKNGGAMPPFSNMSSWHSALLITQRQLYLYLLVFFNRTGSEVYCDLEHSKGEKRK